MSTVRVRRYWKQKHPTEVRSDGGFHWYPEEGASELQRLLASVDNTGRDGLRIVWEIGTDSLTVLRSFHAPRPGRLDSRDYFGYAGMRVSADSLGRGSFRELLPSVLSHVSLPANAPFEHQFETAFAIPLPTESRRAPALVPDDETLMSIIYCAAFGSTTSVSAEYIDALLPWIGVTLRHLPGVLDSQSRSGVFEVGRFCVWPPADISKSRKWLVECLARLLKSGDEDRGCSPAYVWNTVCEVATLLQVDIDVLFDLIDEVDHAWQSAESLQAYLVRVCALTDSDPVFEGNKDAGWLWTRFVHYWGRGLLRSGLAQPIASILALRVLYDHISHLMRPELPLLWERYLRRLRLEALLPGDALSAIASQLPLPAALVQRLRAEAC